MTYREAKKYSFINEHLVEDYIIANTEKGLERLLIIKPLLIAPESHISIIHAESTKIGFNNERSLIELGLMDMNLRVFIVAVISEITIFYQDLYEFLKPTRDARLN